MPQDKVIRRLRAVMPDANRLPATLYAAVKSWLLDNDPDARLMVDWSQTGRQLPETADRLAGEIIWVILCAGRSAQAARTIERKVWGAIRAGRPVVQVFGYAAKAAAIERAWRERERDFADVQAIGTLDAERMVEWCGSLPFVGDATKYQLAKNFGADVCKPDIWLCRLAGIPDKPMRSVKIRFPACMALCRRLAESSGDSVATVDSLLWLACNKGVLRVDAAAGPVCFDPHPITARPILADSDGA